MNAYLNQAIRTHSDFSATARTAPQSSVDFTPSRTSWFASYDEEWAAFLEEKSLQKSHFQENLSEPEALPRVWNVPHG